jgi:NAD(P)-dependent dehydrogenase (short-subunit alcohol dehydrogenase family)
MGSRGHAAPVDVKPVCLLTGGAGTLGGALYRALIRTHNVAAVYFTAIPGFPSQLRVPLDPLPGRRKGPTDALAFCIQGDLTQRADVRRIVEVALARFERIDVLINSAADTCFHGKLLELSVDDQAVRNQLVTNCIAPISLASAVFQHAWKNQRRANHDCNRCVINVSSSSGLHAHPNVGQAFYGASKAALNLLTRYLAEELQTYGIRANAICPSRFPDSVPTSAVVRKVMQLIGSRVSGEVIEVSRGTGAWQPK